MTGCIFTIGLLMGFAAGYIVREAISRGRRVPRSAS